MGKYIHAGVGISFAKNSEEAGRECVRTAFEKLKEDGGKKPEFAIVFCSGGKYGKNDKTIKKFVESVDSALRELNPEIKWIGCTTAGEISNYGVTEGSAVCLLVESEYIHVGVGVGENVLEDPKKAGVTAAKQALEALKPDKYITPYIKYIAQKKKKPIENIKYYDYWMIVLSRGLTLGEPGREDEVAEGIYSVTGRHIPIIGGCSVDEYLKNNYQFINGQVYDRAVVCLAVTGGLKAGFGYEHGYVETDKFSIVTKSEGRRVFLLDGKPAGERYAEMAGVSFNQLVDIKTKFAFISTPLMKRIQKFFALRMPPKMMKFWSIFTANPLAIRDPYGYYHVRVPMKLERNYIEFTQKIPSKTVLFKLKIDEKKLIDAEKNSIVIALKDANLKKPKIILMFDCTLRKLHIGTGKLEKIIREIITKNPNAIIFGFNTGGEFIFRRDGEANIGAMSVSVGVIGDELITE